MSKRLEALKYITECPLSIDSLAIQLLRKVFPVPHRTVKEKVASRMAEGMGEILAPFNRCLKSGQIFPLKKIKGQSIKIFFFQHFFQIGLLIEQFYFRLTEAMAFYAVDIACILAVGGSRK